MPAKFSRLDETHRTRITIECDGRAIPALEGDTVLTALLINGGILRHTEFDNQPRAGFCLMGACNDCVIWTDDGGTRRACSTMATLGMKLFTSPPESSWFRSDM